jgi:DNA (cytosine-5)-methyltransferase 1
MHLFMKVVGVCSGAGGIEEGWKLAGIKTDVAIEINPIFCKTLKLNHPDTEVICGDFREYIESFGKITLLGGGCTMPTFLQCKQIHTHF